MVAVDHWRLDRFKVCLTGEVGLTDDLARYQVDGDRLFKGALNRRDAVFNPADPLVVDRLGSAFNQVASPGSGWPLRPVRIVRVDWLPRLARVAWRDRLGLVLKFDQVGLTVVSIAKGGTDLTEFVYDLVVTLLFEALDQLGR